MNFGLESWIVKDGNYGEFRRNQTYRFAIEFHSDDLQPVSEPILNSLRLASGSTYEARGTILRVTASSWVIDFGVLAYQQSTPPSWATVGLGVRGIVYLGVDPFFYVAELKDEPGMPDLLCAWVVLGIFLETRPPAVSTDELGDRRHCPNDTSPTFEEVQSTNSWHDGGGDAHYVLQCEPAAG
jgi:hypothetical protein